MNEVVQPAIAPLPKTAPTAGKQNLLDLDRAGLEKFFVETLGEQKFRAHQVMKWIHHRYVTDFDQMTDLGKGLRAKLHAQAEVVVPGVAHQQSGMAKAAAAELFGAR